MSNFTLKQEGFTSYTAIPNCFIEQYMPYAAGEFVKIYIYLLKCVGENKSELSISRIADAFNNTEKDVVRALKYWQKKGLLRLSFDEENALTSLRIVSLTDFVPDGSSAEPAQEKVTLNVTDAPIPGQPGINLKPAEKRAMQMMRQDTPDAAEHAFPARKEYSRAEIQSFSGQEEISQLFYIIQKYLGRPLTGQDTNTVLYLYDSLKFPAELIEYLFEYCISKGHKSIRYIEKTALGWAESGIRTVQAARKMAGIYSDECYLVLHAFGLQNRKPTRSEADYVSRWTLSYGFDINLILIACGKTMDQLHQPNFEYTDAILKNWKSSGVATLDDIRKLDEAFEQASLRKEKKASAAATHTAAAGTRFNSFQQRSYNYSELEQQLFNK